MSFSVELIHISYLAFAESQAAKAANLRLVAYVFFLNASWFTCGMGGHMMAKAFEGFDSSPPLHIMIFFVLGWAFLFSSHYQLSKEHIA